MSYILEALKKSERERRKGELPDLQTLDVRPASEQKVSWMPVLIAIVLIANVIWLAVWAYHFFHKTTMVDEEEKRQAHQEQVAKEHSWQPSPETPPPQQTHQLQSKRKAVKTLKSIPIEPIDSIESTPLELIAPLDTAGDVNAIGQLIDGGLLIEPRTPRQPPRPASAKIAKTPAGEVRDVPRLQEMPLSFQSQIPPLEFFSHMYANQPRLRTVVINGQNLHEQDRLADGLVLESIYEDGVILSYEGESFKISVLQDWSFD